MMREPPFIRGVYHETRPRKAISEPFVNPAAASVPSMAYDPGQIDATLAAAVGDEPALIAELREAFLDSAKRTLAVLDAADDADGWRAAAARLKGLAASFGAVRLMALADEALAARPCDPAMLRRLHRAVSRL